MLALRSAENRIRRILEIGDCTAFAHELRVVAHGKVPTALLSTLSLQNGQDDGLGGSRQHGAAQYEYVRRSFHLDRRTDLLRHIFDMAQVEFSILQAGSAHANERN